MNHVDQFGQLDGVEFHLLNEFRWVSPFGRRRLYRRFVLVSVADASKQVSMRKHIDSSDYVSKSDP